ncbi:MAG: DUF29 family protein [Cyanobacteria bacterium P01_G01_bin.19]
MEELLELRRYIEEKNYDAALEIVGELEEMSKEDKLNKIYSFAVILLIHLIKQEVEQRTTRSWNVSIRNSVREINCVNKLRKSGEHYATDTELKEIIAEALPAAIARASLEVKEGLYEAKDLMALFDNSKLIDHGFELIEKQ